MAQILAPEAHILNILYDTGCKYYRYLFFIIGFRGWQCPGTAQDGGTWCLSFKTKCKGLIRIRISRGYCKIVTPSFPLKMAHFCVFLHGKQAFFISFTRLNAKDLTIFFSFALSPVDLYRTFVIYLFYSYLFMLA